MTTPALSHGFGVNTRTRVLAAAGVGVVVGVVVGLLAPWRYGLMTGWMLGSTVLLVWNWLTIWPMDGPTTKSHALREDPGRGGLHLVVILAALASLAAVSILLVRSTGNHILDAALGFLSVVLAWGVVHTIYTVRYAGAYYSGEPGGIDFNGDTAPQYSDFAYVSLSVGMTYQVSDTSLSSKTIRQMVLRHALLSFIFGAVILAATINIVAGLAN